MLLPLVGTLCRRYQQVASLAFQVKQQEAAAGAGAAGAGVGGMAAPGLLSDDGPRACGSGGGGGEGPESSSSAGSQLWQR